MLSRFLSLCIPTGILFVVIHATYIVESSSMSMDADDTPAIEPRAILPFRLRGGRATRMLSSGLVIGQESRHRSTASQWNMYLLSQKLLCSCVWSMGCPQGRVPINSYTVNGGTSGDI